MKKRLSVIADDNIICVDGECISIESKLSFVLENNIHSIQWDHVNKKGEIEYKDGSPNKKIDTIEKYKYFIEVFNLQAEENQRRITEEQKQSEINTDWEAIFKSIRNGKLYESDWTQMPDNNLSEEQKNQWRIYRQSLRDLPEKISDYKLLCKDSTHNDWPKPPI